MDGTESSRDNCYGRKGWISLGWRLVAWLIGVICGFREGRDGLCWSIVLDESSYTGQIGIIYGSVIAINEPHGADWD
jgi:hypothetical protein